VLTCRMRFEKREEGVEEMVVVTAVAMEGQKLV
jgi:hypothetical protein